MKGGCQEHRKWMELLGVQLQLKNGEHDPKEKKEIEERIKALEKELEVD
ncbi:MAG: hypothetical protein JRI74_08840 [Deltaproteobacteria bacterium]|jgi:hypothetical protein|nr:hypothetical protein [Deltaproteobacteria bacterium]MBW2216046.1 hypothetical protein [Deltaproteobacteria bacterium]